MYEKYKEEGEGSDLSLSLTECSPILITYKCVMHCSLKVSQLHVVQASQVLSDIWLKKMSQWASILSNSLHLFAGDVSTTLGLNSYYNWYNSILNKSVICLERVCCTVILSFLFYIHSLLIIFVNACVVSVLDRINIALVMGLLSLLWISKCIGL